MKHQILKFILVFCFLIPSICKGQANLLNARVPQDVGQLNEKQVLANDEEPLEYGFVDDRDVLWSKTVWEIIDLDERINFPLYYPTETDNLGADRRSLWDVLKMGFRTKKLLKFIEDYFQIKSNLQKLILDKH